MKKIIDGIRKKGWSRELVILASAAFFMNFSLALKNTAFTNFANELGIQANQLGLIESLREVPGLLTAFMAMLTYFITESLLASLSLLVLGLGMFMFSFAGGFPTLVLASMVYSVGFHLYFPLQDAMTLKMGSKEEGGKQLGRIGSVASFAALLGMGSIIILGEYTSTKTIFIIAGIAGLFGGIAMFKMPRPDIHLKKKTLIWKKKYRFYYVLTFLSGCRRHIFTIFAPFVLVKIYNVSLPVIAALMTLNQLINIFARRRIGRLIDNMGEKVALTINYSVLIGVFLGYGFIKSLPFLFLFYIIDNLCFGFNMAISTYLHKIVEGDDLGPSLAMGTTVNHIAAIIIPFIGGLIWDYYGYKYAFIMGSFVVTISLIITHLIKDLDTVNNDIVA